MRALNQTLSLTGLLLTAAVLGQLILPSARWPAPAVGAGHVGPVAAGRAIPSGLPTAPARTASLIASTPDPAPAPAAATPDPDDAPYYDAGGQYTARYEQTANTWRLLPMDGPELVIDAGDCSTGATASPGIWLLVVEADGHAGLVAPSATRLAAGASDHVALRDCVHASGRELAVPPPVLAVLAAKTGAIYVDQ